jgi:ribosomal protein S18 acetylase RimI-like enzyme
MTSAFVRNAVGEDANVLSVLATEVWLDTYAREGVLPAYATYLIERYSPAAFQRSLEAGDEHTIISARGPFVLGYAKLVVGQSLATPEHGTVELATLYVRSRHKRQKIGSMLLRHALLLASKSGHSHLYLTVNHENHDALNFYRAHGFQKAGNWTFLFEGIEVPNIVMKIPLELAGLTPSP